MKQKIFSNWYSLVVISLFLFGLVFQSCKKTSETRESIASEESTRKPKDPPPPPPAFSFNCSAPTISGSFMAGVPTSCTVTFSYTSSPGGSHNGYTSAAVNGITFTTPPGTLNVGSGTITYTASGTPTSTGQFMATVGLSGLTVGCSFVINVLNPPVSGPTIDPGASFGSTGVINFTYKGQQVAYKTVRAKDGKIWLQQNLGSPQVAFHHNDEASYGDYFQWGRWDDGHQAASSSTITGGSSLLNPANIASGNSNFIVGQTAGSRWWGSGGLTTNTWSGSSATSTNGKDPCIALGAGWRLPTSADWQNLKNHEDLEGATAAYMSNLKLTAAGFRDAYGGFVFKNGESYYWSSTANNIYATGLLISDNTYSAALQASERGQGYSCRCVKD